MMMTRRTEIYLPVRSFMSRIGCKQGSESTHIPRAFNRHVYTSTGGVVVNCLCGPLIVTYVDRARERVYADIPEYP